MGTPTPEEAGWENVYETVELDGNSVTVPGQGRGWGAVSYYVCVS